MWETVKINGQYQKRESTKIECTQIGIKIECLPHCQAVIAIKSTQATTITIIGAIAITNARADIQIKLENKIAIIAAIIIWAASVKANSIAISPTCSIIIEKAVADEEITALQATNISASVQYR